MLVCVRVFVCVCSVFLDDRVCVQSDLEWALEHSKDSLMERVPVFRQRLDALNKANATVKDAKATETITKATVCLFGLFIDVAVCVVMCFCCGGRLRSRRLTLT